MNYKDALKEDARLIILRELATQPDGRMNSALLSQVLDAFGHARSREWLHSQLHILADIGAVCLTEAGTVLIAQIRKAGLDHVQRRVLLAGVARPSPAV